MVRTIYLSGPISLNGSLNENEIKKNIALFKQFEFILTNGSLLDEIKVLNPCNIPKQKSWNDYMKLAIPMVCESDGILMLPNWQLSRGSVFELFVATTIEIDVFFDVYDVN